MSGLEHFWSQSDGVGRSVALLLLAMSVTAWVLVLWKGWLLRRAIADIARAVPAFWDAASLADGAGMSTTPASAASPTLRLRIVSPLQK